MICSGRPSWLPLPALTVSGHTTAPRVPALGPARSRSFFGSTTSCWPFKASNLIWYSTSGTQQGLNPCCATRSATPASSLAVHRADLACRAAAAHHCEPAAVGRFWAVYGPLTPAKRSNYSGRPGVRDQLQRPLSETAEAAASRYQALFDDLLAQTCLLAAPVPAPSPLSHVPSGEQADRSAGFAGRCCACIGGVGLVEGGCLDTAIPFPSPCGIITQSRHSDADVDMHTHTRTRARAHAHTFAHTAHCTSPMCREESAQSSANG